MNLFNIKEENISTKYLILLMILAYTFSISIRMIWVYQFSGVDSFYWDNQLMINTNDGYYFASWVQAIVDGVHQFNPRIENDIFKYALVTITVLAVKLGVSIDTAILYMPTIISSLVVIPIILIARVYKLTTFGFFAALLGSIGWSYYNRTMTGYYDTDMFSAMAPMFIVYFLIKLIEQNEIKNIIYASVMLAIYPFLYDQGQAIVYAMGLIYMAYMIIFHLKEEFTYKSIILISISLTPILLVIKLPLFLIVLFVLLKKDFEFKILVLVSFISFIVFLFFGDVFGLVLSKVLDYAVRGTANEGLHFFSVNQTVREAGKIPFETMANRISGSTFGLIIAVIGYILIVIKNKSFIVTLPLIGIGIFSLIGGLRFTVYAVPVAAMGAIYLFYVIANFTDKKIIKYSLIIFLTSLMLYPNIKHIVGYKVPTVFSKQEVQVLDKLKKLSNPQDYTIAWWDYGYPIWYYSDTNSLIDGGKHNNDNFIVSKVLTTSSQLQASNLARLSVETYVKNKGIIVDKIFKNKQKDQIDPNNFLNNLKERDYKLPKKTVDVYLYLPNRMMNIFPTVNIFSNLDLATGQKYPNNFFYQTQRFKETKDKINLGNNIEIIKNKGAIQIGRKIIKMHDFVVVGYDGKGKLQKKVQTIDKNSPISVIFMRSYNKFLVLDTKMYNSLYIQLFVLENYDKTLFEPVVLSPYAKVYKLKK